MKLLYEPCGCDPRYLRRMRRTWWMRLFLPKRRLYECQDCRERFLLAERPGAPEPQPQHEA